MTFLVAVRKMSACDCSKMLQEEKEGGQLERGRVHERVRQTAWGAIGRFGHRTRRR